MVHTVAKVVPAAALTALVALSVSEGIASFAEPDGVVWRAVQVGSAVVAGIAVYIGAALMLHIEEVDEVKDAVRRRFRG
jgi:hypothetical protein